MNETLHDHGVAPLTMGQYLHSGTCWESLSENWESEFLEMGAFAWLTGFLFQRGSPESTDPDEPEEPDDVDEKSPWCAKQGGLMLWIYERSLSLAFFALFLIAFTIHGWAGTRAYNHDQELHHQSTLTMLAFMRTSTFWFQSLQNWQSEFLGIACMVILSIWLRQKGSPESKRVGSPHSANE